MAVLRVIQQVLRAQLVVERNQIGPRQNRGLAALVEVEALQVHDEAKLQRTIKEVGFGEAQADIAHTRAELAFQRESLAQAQKVVGGVVEPDKAARNTAHAAVQPN